MGNKESSESLVKNINNQLYVNKSTINQLNQQLNQVIANSVVKNAMESGGAIINKQEILFDQIRAKGDIDISDVSQKQVAAITFSAMNQTNARNDAAVQFIQQTLLDLKNHVSQDVLTTMEGTADAKIKTGFLSSLPFGQTTSKAETVNVSTVTAITENVKNISNVVQNRVENNFTTETLTSCIMKINNAQMFKVKDIQSVEGTIRIHNVSQDQAATAVAQCQSIMNATNQIINDTLNTLDVKVDETNSVVSETQEKGKSESTTEKSGFFEGLSKIFSLDSFLSILVVGVIVFIIIIAVLILLFRMGRGNPISVATPRVPLQIPR